MKMEDFENDNQLGVGSEEEESDISDGELQEAFSKGLLKPGLNIPLQEAKKKANNVAGLKQCLADFRRNLPWVERLDLTNGPVADIVAKADGKTSLEDRGEINAEDDFQREMHFYRQAQAAVLEAMPRLQMLKLPTKRPEDYFAEMAKSDQHMQKIRKKLMMKQVAMEKSEKAKKLREQRKYGKKVQTEVLQKRQKEKKAMMTAVKKYQKGMSDKLDFLDGDKDKGKKALDKAAAKKAPSAKRKYKDQKFGFGGKKRGSKWNTKESHDDVSGFRAKVAHGKGGKKFGKGGKNIPNKRPGKNARRKMKSRS
ncbi:probable rRNA-processing protein EBP2 [Brienomyrus brachyistius]|uniref:probable rRNA-processing protein EBP2 n=1 Tax=Brienomyrus brachyistius TaxID=42636 RepID=UPI0020B2B421|nr:probable rRNA-processing protein EBP2 [Brienomyrus brachyistius]